MKPPKRAVPVTAGGLAAVLTGNRFRVLSEETVHAGSGAVLEAAGYDVRHEVRLTGKDRVDMLVGRVAVEVKVAGAAGRVLRQCQRYAHSDVVDEVLLVTTVPAHQQLPSTAGGKPLTVALLTGGAFT
ncbi:MAG: hypothetical protein ACRCYX_12550 [Dermatophilaceae bacterium]